MTFKAADTKRERVLIVGTVDGVFHRPAVVRALVVLGRYQLVVIV